MLELYNYKADLPFQTFLLHNVSGEIFFLLMWAPAIVPAQQADSALHGRGVENQVINVLLQSLARNYKKGYIWTRGMNGMKRRTGATSSSMV